MSTCCCAVITPYYQEDRGLLQRCIDSVKRQTITADDFLIADGYPQDWVDGEGVRHLRLDRAHGDYGNTLGGVGALLTAAERYDGMALVDADNWLEADHVEVCLAAAHTLNRGICDYVIARRDFCRPDGTVISFVDEERTEPRPRRPWAMKALRPQ